MDSSLEIDGFKLRYRIEGPENGTPVLVVGSAIYYPRTFSENLRSKLKMIFMDNRAFAEHLDPKQISVCGMDVLLSDIEALREHLKLGKIVIMGHSGNAFLALEYAKKYSRNVSHAVLLATGTSNHPENAKLADQYFHDTVSPERKKELEEQLALLPADIQKSPDQSFVAFCIRLGPRSWYDFKFDSSSLWSGVRVQMKMVDHLWGQLFRDVDVTRGLSELNMPVFLGLGLFDYLVAPHFTWNPVRPQFRQLTFRIFEKSAHCPQLEEPELFDSELLRWLKASEQVEN